MFHFAPRLRRMDGRFEYTVACRGVSVPVGYCKAYVPYTSAQAHWLGRTLDELERGDPFSYHSEGHATKEEACACYRRYLLDTSLKFYRDSDVLAREMPCHVCRLPTLWIGEIPFLGRWHLCPHHQIRDVLSLRIPDSVLLGWVMGKPTTTNGRLVLP